MKKRLQALEAGGLVHLAVAGDKILGNWGAIKAWKPDIVAIGYDQTKLEEELGEFITNENLSIQLVKISAHDGGRLHSRLLRKRNLFILLFRYI